MSPAEKIAANAQQPDSLQIPGVGAPLRRALANAGLETLADLDGKDYEELLTLHGVGNKGLSRVLEALRAAGGDMLNAPSIAEIEALKPSVKITPGHTGKVAKDIKTKVTAVDPAQFIAELEWPRRVQQGQELLALFSRVTGAPAKMWGPTIVGFGEVHYASSSGREGDWFAVGFSPRKASISLYGLQSAPHFADLAARLGKHRLGAGCLYLNQLEDIDLATLEELVTAAWTASTQL